MKPIIKLKMCYNEHFIPNVKIILIEHLKLNNMKIMFIEPFML